MPRKPAKPTSSTPAAAAGELALVQRIRSRSSRAEARGARSPELQLGIGDDCAILLPAAGEELVITTDFCLEGRHWRRDWNPPASVGHRTLARGLSDIAAMGAKPVAAFLSLAMPAPRRGTPSAPHGPANAFLDGFLDGLLALARTSNVPLAGGDTSTSPSAHVLADIVVLGTVPRRTALLRSGARPGDLLYCTGTLGGSFAERTAVAARSASVKAASSPAVTSQPATAVPVSDHPFLFPRPRLAAGQALRAQSLASACLDLSDGLSTDLHHLCDASGVAAEVELGRLPPSPWLQTLPAERREHALLHGGEDYELLFTAPSSTSVPGRLGGVRTHCIGTILRRHARRPVVTLVASDGTRRPLERGGWEHLL